MNMAQSPDQHRDRAIFYTPLSFMHRQAESFADEFLAGLNVSIADKHIECFSSRARLMVRHLPWDSQYFQCPTYRLDFADWADGDPTPIDSLAHTLTALKDELSRRHPRYYLFMEVPSEDLTMLQALGLAGYRLIETRLTYFRDDLHAFNYPRRFSVRPATEADIPDLRNVAMSMANRFDRFHADSFFPTALADGFLATFVENSVGGFADIVLVPAGFGDMPGAFLTGNFMPDQPALAGVKIGRMVLSAVAINRRGWYLKLISELSYYFQECGVSLCYLTTQSTNQAVIRVWEKLGYHYGKSTHIFATHEENTDEEHK